MLKTLPHRLMVRGAYVVALGQLALAHARNFLGEARALGAVTRVLQKDPGAAAQIILQRMAPAPTPENRAAN